MKKMREKKMNNKGFSLVELIIVVAIMAVLIGVLAPTYMRYVERSRVGVDTQFADSLRTAMETAVLDPNIEGAPAASGYFDDITTSSEFWKEVATTVGAASADITKVDDMLKSKSSVAKRLSYTYDASTGSVTIKFATDAVGEVTVQ